MRRLRGGAGSRAGGLCPEDRFARGGVGLGAKRASRGGQVGGRSSCFHFTGAEGCAGCRHRGQAQARIPRGVLSLNRGTYRRHVFGTAGAQIAFETFLFGSDLLIGETLSSGAFPAEDHIIETPTAGQEVCAYSSLVVGPAKADAGDSELRRRLRPRRAPPPHCTTTCAFSTISAYL